MLWLFKIYFRRFLIHVNSNYVVLYTQYLRYNICSAWFLDIRISTCWWCFSWNASISGQHITICVILLLSFNVFHLPHPHALPIHPLYYKGGTGRMCAWGEWQKLKERSKMTQMVKFTVTMTSTCTHKGSIFHYNT